MTTNILTYGEPGSGKTTALKNLDPKETFIISANPIDKCMPFFGWRKKYIQFHRKHNPKGNIARVTKHDQIIALICYIIQHRPDIKVLIIDDIQYIMSTEYLKRTKEKAFDVFPEIAQHFFAVIEAAGMFGGPDSKCVFMGHSELSEETNKIKLKTVGKMLDRMINMEGVFDIIFYSFAEENKFLFRTRNNGKCIARAPGGMFKEETIGNDLSEVFNIIDNFNNFDEYIEMNDPKPVKSKQPKKET